MEYIILDLEWNNGYSRKHGKFVNEIIEIGALRVDQDLHLCDGFKQLVKPELTKKLSGRVKQLTHISNEDVRENGVSFQEAVDRLTSWLGDQEQVFLTWSNTDLYILAAAFQFYFGKPQIPFIHRYMDAQKYCQSSFTDLKNQNQISLLNAAVKLKIEQDGDSLHRALADCVLTAKCFIKCYEKDKLPHYIRNCDAAFFEKMMFKSFYVADWKEAGVDLEKMPVSCPVCGHMMRRLSAFESVNHAFRSVFLCKQCHQKYYVAYRIKQQYDHLDIKKRFLPAKQGKKQKKKRIPKC